LENINFTKANETANDFKMQGNKNFSEGKLEEAIYLFTEAIKLDDSNSIYYSNKC
jgi:hypothetical protein